jgi:hypothetical protein
MPTLLDSIYNSENTEPTKQEPEKKKTLLEDVFNSTSSGAATDVQLGQYGVGESKFDTNVTPENVVNLQEIRAQKQSALDKWGNGFVKAAGTFGTSFLENTAGVAIGMGSAIINNDIEELYNNPFAQSLDEFNQYLSKNLPNYTTKAEQDYNLIQKLGTSNFWSDQVLNGAAFLGAAVSTGVGLNKFASLGKLARAGKVINEAEVAAEGWQVLDKAARTIKIVDAVDFGKNAALMSYGESSIEARGIYNDTKNALIEQYKLVNNGEEPQGTTLQEIESRAKAAGNFGFATNLAITGTTNALLFPKLLTKGYDANKLGINKIALQGTEFVAEQTPITKTVGKELLKGALEEGGQELGQLLTQKTLTDYYSKGYENRGEKQDFVNSLVYGLKQTFGTEEGLESFFLGALLGGPAGAIQTRGETAQRNTNTQQLADLMNTPGFKKTVNSFDNYVRATNYEQDKEEALAKGNKFDYLNAEFNQNKTMVKQFLDNSGKDLLIQQYKDMQGMPEEEFKKVAGYDLETPLPKSQTEIIDNAVKLIDNLDKTNRAVEQLFPYSPVLYGNAENYKALTTNLWHYSTSIDNMNARVKDINHEVLNLVTSKGLTLSGDGVTIPYQVNDNPLVNSQLEKYNEDLAVAKKYKEELIKSYQLLANPVTQKQALGEILTTAQVKAEESAAPIAANRLENQEAELPTLENELSAQPEVLPENQTLNSEIVNPEDTQNSDFSTLIASATSPKELDSILDQIDNTGIASPELISQISAKREELTNQAPIDTKFGTQRKRAQTIWKTTAGQDNDKKLPEQRYFRFLKENSIPEGAKLQVVTRNNNKELFEQLLDEGARKYEEKTGINTIYTLLVDKDNNPIYSSQEGEKIESGDKNNLVYATLLTENGVKGTGLTGADLAKQDLNNFRDKLLEQTFSGVFLPITGKSKGIVLNKGNGKSDIRNRYLIYDPTNVEVINSDNVSQIMESSQSISRISDLNLTEEELQSIEEMIDNPVISLELQDQLRNDLKNATSKEDIGKLFKKLCTL